MHGHVGQRGLARCARAQEGPKFGAIGGDAASVQASQPKGKPLGGPNGTDRCGSIGHEGRLRDDHAGIGAARAVFIEKGDLVRLGPRLERCDHLHHIVGPGVDVAVQPGVAGLGRDEAATHYGDDLDQRDDTRSALGVADVALDGIDRQRAVADGPAHGETDALVLGRVADGGAGSVRLD